MPSKRSSKRPIAPRVHHFKGRRRHEGAGQLDHRRRVVDGADLEVRPQSEQGAGDIAGAAADFEQARTRLWHARTKGVVAVVIDV